MTDLVAFPTVDVVVQAPRELNEALTALEDVVVDLKAGKSVSEIAATRFTEFARAVDGLQKLPQEAKALPFEAAQAGVIHGLRIVKVLLAK